MLDLPLTVFQSRNRGSFDFKSSWCSSIQTSQTMFQSRNRGSFDFKQPHRKRQTSISPQQSFNLVIEVLLISSEELRTLIEVLVEKFQSRNRGSFDFKFPNTKMADMSQKE